VHAPSGVEPALAARLYEQSNAGRWRVSREQFEAALASSLTNARAAASAAASIDAERYLSALHLEDLALAVACGDGDEGAWEHFIAEYRPLMARAAMAIDPAGGSELGDSLHTDLFGLQVKDGARQSLFRYFHGRSKLGTWLRAVLSQRHIDKLRTSRRHEPLPNEDEEKAGAASVAAVAGGADSSPPAADRARFLAAMRESLASAVDGLETRDRLRLACYYGQDMTLAAIGRMTREHEATVSRQLARTRRNLRAAIETCLRDRHGLDDAAIHECFQSVAGDAGMLDLDELFGPSEGDRSARSTVPDRSRE